MQINLINIFFLTGEDEEWSDSEKTPSVSSGVDGGGSGVSSPAPVNTEEDISLPPPPRLNIVSQGLLGNSNPEDFRLRLHALSEDARKTINSLAENFEVHSYLIFPMKRQPCPET